jgi:membrane associated rhomboid family serine protease
MLTGSIIGDIKYQFRYGNMVVKLIFVNVAVWAFISLFNLGSFLFQSPVLYQLVVHKLEAPASLQNLAQQPWSVFTYMFFHQSFFHILFNMLWFYWFGEIFVLYLGDKKILPLYIIGGLFGALFYMLAFNFIPVFKPEVQGAYMLGASASIYAIVCAAATINPEHEISLLFIGRIKIVWVAIIALFLDLTTIPYNNAGGYIAHAGGALSGFLYIKSLRSGFDIVSPFNRFFDWVATVFKPRSKVKVTYKNPTRSNTSQSNKKREVNDQEKVDEILDKIARSGYDSLSKDEKDFLFHFSKK